MVAVVGLVLFVVGLHVAAVVAVADFGIAMRLDHPCSAMHRGLFGDGNWVKHWVQRCSLSYVIPRAYR